MKQVCKFNSKRDIQKSRPGLSTNIALALENGVVLDTGIDSVYNDIDNPTNIWGRVQDVFTALDVQKRMLNSGKVSNPSVQPSQPGSGATE